MEQRMVVKNEQQCIYYMKESNLEFYLLIPNCQQVKIVLGIFANVTDELVKSIPIQSDKAVRVVCNMDTWIYNQVAKSAEENNRTFEDELEDILYWTFENEENQTGDGYTGL